MNRTSNDIIESSSMPGISLQGRTDSRGHKCPCTPCFKWSTQSDSLVHPRVLPRCSHSNTLVHCLWNYSWYWTSPWKYRTEIALRMYAKSQIPHKCNTVDRLPWEIPKSYWQAGLWRTIVSASPSKWRWTLASGSARTVGRLASKLQAQQWSS